jgi:hypothetical protein|tara:strand:+ start:5028 stop:5255 length:228 start_codon:yes stop_codon:yes gene_type:complete
MKRLDLTAPCMKNAVNGAKTFTAKGRKIASLKIKEFHSGWPEWKKGTFEKIMTASKRRFDEPGMEIRFLKGNGKI